MKLKSKLLKAVRHSCAETDHLEKSMLNPLSGFGIIYHLILSCSVCVSCASL